MTRSQLKKAPKGRKTRNKWFDSLEKNEQRQVLAFDALWLSRSKLVLEHGSGYLNITNNETGTNSLQLLLREKKAGECCKACALGAMICSYSYTKNKYKVDQDYINILNPERITSNKLDDYFTNDELLIIEMLFEADVNFILAEEENVSRIFNLSYEDVEERFQNLLEQSDAQTRFEVIMNHIIDSNGEEVFNEEYFAKFNLNAVGLQ